MKFTMEFDMDNAAFDEEEAGVQGGAKSILAGVTEKIDQGRMAGVIFDHNGARIGEWAIEGERLGYPDEE